MGSIWNHLARPLSYRDSNGEIRYLSPKDVVRVKNYVLCLLAAMVVKVVFSSKSLKSKVFSAGFGTASVFYFVTAFFKILDRHVKDSSKRNADVPDLSKRCSDYESFARAKREIGLNAFADALAHEQHLREDEMRQPKWEHCSRIIDQERDDQL